MVDAIPIRLLHLLCHAGLLVDHLLADSDNVVLDQLLSNILDVLLRVNFADISSLQLLLGQFAFLADSLLLAIF